MSNKQPTKAELIELNSVLVSSLNTYANELDSLKTEYDSLTSNPIVKVVQFFRSKKSSKSGTSSSSSFTQAGQTSYSSSTTTEPVTTESVFN